MRTLLEPAGKIQVQTKILKCIGFQISRNAFPDPEIQTLDTSLVRSGNEVYDTQHGLDACSPDRTKRLPYNAFLGHAMTCPLFFGHTPRASKDSLSARVLIPAEAQANLQRTTRYVS
jgi:hypothetical protein